MQPGRLAQVPAPSWWLLHITRGSLCALANTSLTSPTSPFICSFLSNLDVFLLIIQSCVLRWSENLYENVHPTKF